MAYVHGVDAVGQALSDASDADELVAIPSTCLLEAYSVLGFGAEFEMLGVLRAHPSVQVVQPSPHHPDDLPFIGGMAARAKRLGAGHAAYLAMASAAAVYTTRADEIHTILGTGWPVVEV